MPWTSLEPRLSEKLSLRQAPLPFLLSELDLILAPLASLEDILRKRLEGNVFGTLRPPAWTASLQQLEPWEEENARATETLEEHLLPQIVLCPGIPEDLSERLGERLLSWVDSRGYLRGSDREIAENLGIPLSSWKETLKNLQHWVDPPGLLARDLAECLLLQLRHRKKPSPEALELLEKYAPLLKEKKFEEIRKAAKWTPRQLERALEALRSLDPAPGNSFGTILYVQPEIEITLEEEVPKFRLLREYLPKITADPEMLSWREEPRLQRHWKEFLRLNVCLALRCRGRMLVTREAGAVQKHFLGGKEDAPGPLTLTEVAQHLGFAASTVHRIARATWLRTPRGTLPLESFFSRPLRSRPDLSVAQLRLYLEKHRKGKSLSDLAEELQIPLRTLSWHLRRMRRQNPFL